MFGRKKKNKTDGGTILGGIAEGAMEIGEAVVDVGGSAAKGMDGCLEGCFGCATVIVIVAIPSIVLAGWTASKWLA